ncbi:MAG: DUF1844 domain-containing protein [Candidatus Marinimicrobia bacterium]|nr:DUF1844 domain-containing protein [Candidatus Neomarinimicrobiota bacterium]
MSKDNPTQDEQYFLQLVSSISTGAWIAMGKLANPVTGKIERNMQQAAAHLDTLDMLVKRTAGNLADWEEQYLTHLNTELKMNYLDEAKKPDPAAPEGQEAPADSTEDKPANDPAENTEDEDK